MLRLEEHQEGRDHSQSLKTKQHYGEAGTLIFRIPLNRFIKLVAFLRSNIITFFGALPVEQDIEWFRLVKDLKSLE